MGIYSIFFIALWMLKVSFWIHGKKWLWKKINKFGIKKSGGKISGLKLSYIMNSFENSLEKLS
jgi:hypothetical protein